MSQETSGIEPKHLRKLALCLDELRKVHEQLPMQTAMVFTMIALHPGCTSKQISEWTGLAQSSTSRNLRALGSKHWQKNKEGYGLIETKPDPYETRRLIATLTPKGRRVAASLTHFLEK